MKKAVAAAVFNYSINNTTSFPFFQALFFAIHAFFGEIAYVNSGITGK